MIYDLFCEQKREFGVGYTFTVALDHNNTNRQTKNMLNQTVLSEIPNSAVISSGLQIALFFCLFCVLFGCVL